MTDRKYVLVFLLSFSLSGCVGLASPQQEENIPSPVSDIENPPDAWQGAAAQIGPVENSWIRAFDDPKLTALVNEAQSNNRDLRAAASNVERSWLQAKQAGAALSPQVSATLGSNQSGRVDGDSDDVQFGAGLQVNWELDVWGRVRSGKRASFNTAEAVEADYRYTQLSIASAVARAYITAISARQQKQISEDVVDTLLEVQRLVDVRLKEGLASQQDLALTKTNVANAQDTLEQAKLGYTSALRGLESLLGRYPAASIDIGKTLPKKPAEPLVGIPSDLLERRPDVIAAERRLAASLNALESAKAARLPAFSLSAGVDGASDDLTEVLNPSNLVWRAASNLLAPLIDGGARKTEVEINTVNKEAAFNAYVNTALKAFSEVEQSLAEGQSLSRRKLYLETAAESSQESLRLARLRYDEGEIDLLSVLQIQTSEFESKSNLLTLNRLELSQFIDLSLALGGEW